MKKNVLKVGSNYFRVSCIEHMEEPVIRDVCGFWELSYKVNNKEYSMNTNMHSKMEIEEVYNEARKLFRTFTILDGE